MSQRRSTIRIGASKFGEIIMAARNNDEQWSSDIARDIKDHYGHEESRAIQYGNEHENDALYELEEMTSLRINPANKYIPSSNEWLVCIPDGIARQRSRDGGNTMGIVEVKCPYICRDKTFHDAVNYDRNFCLEYNNHGELQLKRDHFYYYQVQGMLNMMHYSRCYFAVWTPTEFHWEIIYRDRELWNFDMFPKLYDFYREHILHESFDGEEQGRLLDEFYELWRSSSDDYVDTEELRYLFQRLNYNPRNCQLDYIIDKVNRNGTIYFPALLEHFERFTEMMKEDLRRSRRSPVEEVFIGYLTTTEYR